MARIESNDPRALPGTPPSACPQAGSWTERPAHETSDVNVPALVAGLVLLVIAAFVIHASLWWWATTPRPVADTAAARWPLAVGRLPETEQRFPRLQVSPEHDLQQFRASEQEKLERSSAEHMPIERAMKLIVQRGATKVSAGQQPELSPTQLQQRRAMEMQEKAK